MAHKTFISYKLSEAQALRDAIIDKLGDDATYYKGETSESPDLSDTTTGNIKRVLSEMIYDTTVMIIVISPNMTQSKWMAWEIGYAIKSTSRNDRTSHTNGFICVVQKNFDWEAFARGEFDDGYEWAKSNGNWDNRKLFPIIRRNRNNKLKHIINNSYDMLEHYILPDDYMPIVTETEFLADPHRYINEAFNRSTHLDCYNIAKEVD